MKYKLSDDMLMAYADGELDDAEQERIGRLIAAHPAALARLRRFERTGRALGLAFEVGDRPLPAALRQMTPTRPGAGTSRKRTANALDWLTAWPALTRPRFAAAALMLIAAFLGGRIWENFVAVPPATRILFSETGPLLASGALREALETRPSPGGGGEGAPVAALQTFRASGGAFCREYAAQNEGRAAARGVACRQPDGEWAVSLHIANAGGPPSQGGYAPAGGGLRQTLETYMHEIMDGNPLTPDEEKRAIGSRWNSAQ